MRATRFVLWVWSKAQWSAVFKSKCFWKLEDLAEECRADGLEVVVSLEGIAPHGHF